jgi:hypothetical protein
MIRGVLSPDLGVFPAMRSRKVKVELSELLPYDAPDLKVSRKALALSAAWIDPGTADRVDAKPLRGLLSDALPPLRLWRRSSQQPPIELETICLALKAA